MRKTRPPYVPSPEEIMHRAAMLKMMTRAGCSDELIDSVFYQDHPTSKRVLEMVCRYGHNEAFKRIMEFMI